MPIPVKKTITVKIGPQDIQVAQGDKFKISHNGVSLVGGEDGVTIPDNGIITIDITAVLGDT